MTELGPVAQYMMNEGYLGYSGEKGEYEVIAGSNRYKVYAEQPDISGFKLYGNFSKVGFSEPFSLVTALFSRGEFEGDYFQRQLFERAAELTAKTFDLISGYRHHDPQDANSPIVSTIKLRDCVSRTEHDIQRYVRAIRAFDGVRSNHVFSHMHQTVDQLIGAVIDDEVRRLKANDS